jgi:hypothetical protein
MTHHGVYCSADWRDSLEENTDCVEDTFKLQLILENLLYENGIDFFMQAHVHNYERDTPIFRNVTVPSEVDSLHYHKNPEAPIYITTGIAGNRLEHNDPTSRTP